MFMSKTKLTIHPAVLDCYAAQFRHLYLSHTDKELPADNNLRTTHFEKNDCAKEIRAIIQTEMGPQAFFHPRNLYTYIFGHLREIAESGQKDNNINWDISNRFPLTLFQLISYNSFEHFLDQNREILGEEVITQQQYFLSQLPKENDNAKFLIDAFNCYVSDISGFKIGKIGNYSDGTSKLIFIANDQGSYEGTVSNNSNWTTFNFWQTSEENHLHPPKKNTRNQEVTWKFLSQDDFRQHVFLFGTYSAVNRNDYDNNNPARVAGPIILERINIQNIKEKELEDLPDIQSNQVDPIIAAKVSGRRIEEKKTYSRKSNRGFFLEKRNEELSLINKNNSSITDPQQIIGNYCCFLYSKRYDALKMITFQVKSDLTVTGKATKYCNDKTIINYAGHVDAFRNGLFSIRAIKETSQFPCKGTFIFKSQELPMYGLLSYIGSNLPKARHAVLIKSSEKFNSIIGNFCPTFIPLNSPVYDELDKQFNLTSFFANNYLETERIDPKVIVRDNKVRFQRLLSERNGDFKDLQGLYEEYYYDQSKKVIRKDYMLIQPQGTVLMVGSFRYKGNLENLGNRFLIDMRYDKFNKSPVFYLIHKETNKWNILSGICCTSTSDNQSIISNTLFLHKLSDEIISEKTFFKKFEKEVSRISPGTSQFKELNDKLANLGQALNEQSQNHLLRSPFKEPDLNEFNCRQIANTYFHAACYLASQGKVSTSLKAVKELNKAFQYGFKNRPLLEREIQEGKALYSIREMINLDKFLLDEEGYLTIPK